MMPFNRIILISLIIITTLTKAKFLSIRVPNEPLFTSLHFYDLLSYMLKDSIPRIVMNHNVEIIVSSFKQVKIANEIIESDGDYPQWKLNDIIYRDDFEGIYLSKKNDRLVIYSLVLSINDDFPFSISRDWSVQFNYHSQKLINGSVIVFSGSSPRLLYKMIQILFKKDFDIFLFKNSSFILDNKEKEESIYHSTIDNEHDKEGKFLQLNYMIDLPQAFYSTITRNKQVIYFTDKVKNSTPCKFNKVCYINSKIKYNPAEALHTIKEILDNNKNKKKNKKKNIIQESIQIFSHPISNFFKAINEKEKLIQVPIMKIISNSKILLILFENIIEKLFFNTFIDAVIILIHYDLGKRLLSIKYDDSVFSPVIGQYLYCILKEYNNFYLGLYFETTFVTIMIEDDNDHTFSYEMKELNGINLMSILMKNKKIFIFARGFSFDSQLERIGDTTINVFDITKDKIMVILNLIKTSIENTKMRGKGVELRFDSENKKLLLYFFKANNPGLQLFISSYPASKIFYQWILSIYESETKMEVSTKPINSFENILFLWNFITEKLFLSIEAINMPSISKFKSFRMEGDSSPPSSPSSSPLETFNLEIKTIKIENLNERLCKRLIKLLLSQKSIYNIKRFRLKYEFNVEIDIAESQDEIDEFIESINRELKEKISIACENVREEDKLAIPFRSRYHPFGKSIISLYYQKQKRNHFYSSLESATKKRFSIHENLSWDNAVELLLNRQPLNSSLIQVMERSGDYPSSGNVLVFYYKNKINLKKHIEDLNHKEQIIRMGKLENHQSFDYSFLFVQYSFNRLNYNTFVYDIYSNFEILSFDLLINCRIDLLVDLIASYRKIIDGRYK